MITAHSGSPPHGRGKVKTSQKGLQGQRITPAWAGKRPTGNNPADQNRDHPRMGGEKPNRILWNNFKRGSPPHGRGKDRTEKHKQRRRRITPAWAGKSSLIGVTDIAPVDHPRMGGEKFGAVVRHCRVLGSPPHGRGKAYSTTTTTTSYRITPAWAGKSNNQPVATGFCRDHPRMGGEK